MLSLGPYSDCSSVADIQVGLLPLHDVRISPSAKITLPFLQFCRSEARKLQQETTDDAEALILVGVWREYPVKPAHAQDSV